jgi:hypothetical protein
MCLHMGLTRPVAHDVLRPGIVSTTFWNRRRLFSFAFIIKIFAESTTLSE